MLSWFTLLSCSSSPTVQKKPTQRLPSASPVIPQTTDGIYEQYQRDKQASKAANQYQKNTNYQSANFDFNSISNERFLNWVNNDFDGSKKAAINDYYQFIYNHTGYVPPMEQMLRSARSWLMCGFEPYEVPPRESWDTMIDTIKLLKLLRSSGYLPDEFEIVSVYRNPELNRCAKGSSGSKHLLNAAVDIYIKYQYPSDRDMVEEGLCQFWRDEGHLHNMGLGLYRSGTIHIDTQGQRTWGSTYSKNSSRCLR